MEILVFKIRTTPPFLFLIIQQIFLFRNFDVSKSKFKRVVFELFILLAYTICNSQYDSIYKYISMIMD